ncbi:pitrilysin family protein [Brevundimonas sp. SORGH_AS_0993]|uniref:M16 family metallopeptidase n=1 Tax=Brevundimonas sp. SORGH_AS_0993 TaxID=3041794 RepID=UPI002782AD09|nr:pitrilysin family protein [Brevundimonas sp. SORGH_AS_0993]MDQ1154608.1 zinc protease [Brevundimonas sp. SORGH_AS_0993]
MRRTGSLVAAAALLAVSTPVWASAPAARNAPAAAPAVQAAPVSELVREVDIPYAKFTLANGLTVLVHEDHKAPVVAVSVWYNVGSKDEPAGKTGFAHLFEHLMFGGSENAPGSYFTPMRNMGATDMNGTTWFDRTNYFETVPTPALEQALFLESDRMGYMLGAITQETLDLQRGVVQNEKRQNDNQPYGLNQYRQLEALFPEGHPYRHTTIGSMADLDAASMQTVRDWFTSNYGPNNAVLVLAGDITPAKARELTEKYFGPIPRGPVNTPAQASVPTLAAPINETIRDRVANAQVEISWAVPGMLDPDSVPLSVGASVLGGLASSRLDNELVRGEQSAVSVSAGNSAFHRVGLFEITLNIKPGHDPAAVEARAREILNGLIANGPTADEVERVKTQYLSRRIQGLEQVGGFGGKAVALAEGQLYAGDPEFYKKQLAAYAAVTPAQVQAALQKWLTRPAYTLTTLVGEREAYQEAAANPAGANHTPAPPIERVARMAKPEIGQVANVDFPAVERARLSNGMEVVYAQRDAVPVTKIAVDFDAGLAADDRAKLGLQTLMLDLMDEGTQTLDARQLAEAQEVLGAAISTGATMDRSVISLNAVTPNLVPSVALLADVIKRPAFAPAELERLRAARLSRIAAERTQPAALANRALPELIYGADSPYGRPFSGNGDEASIRSITDADVRADYAKWIRPDNAKVFVVSDKPLAEILPILNAQLGQWVPPASPKPVKDFSAPIPAATPRIVLIDRPQSPQSYIMGGEVLSASGTDDLLVLNAANNVLGNDFLSRINSDLRETKGWSYGVGAYVSGFQHRVPYLVTAPVQADQTGPAIAALNTQFNDFLKGGKGVTPAELERTVNGNTRRLAGSYETSGAVLGALRTNDMLGRPDDYPETVAARTNALTADQLDAAARAAIDPARFVWVVVGDAAKVKPQLDALGLPVEVRAAAPTAQ